MKESGHTAIVSCRKGGQRKENKQGLRMTEDGTSFLSSSNHVFLFQLPITDPRRWFLGESIRKADPGFLHSKSHALGSHGERV